MNGDENLDHQKAAAFYGASVQAWIANRSEFDKQIMLFSAGGIGYLFVSAGKLDEWTALALWLTAVSLFATAIFFALMVLRKNADYIEAFIGNRDGCKTQKLGDTIGKHTRCATGFFVAGSATTAVFVLQDPVLGLIGCS